MNIRTSGRLRRIETAARRLEDLSPAIKKAAELARDDIISGVREEQKDADNRTLAPLSDATLARKRRQGLDMRTLVESGAMTDPKTFTIRAGPRRGSVTHKAPTGSHTKYGRTSRRGKTRQYKYDYGLAHQRGAMNVRTGRPLPERKWWPVPESKRWAGLVGRITTMIGRWLTTGHVT